MTFGPRWFPASLRSSLRFGALFTVSALTFVAGGWVVGCGDDSAGGNGGSGGSGGQVSLAGVVYEGGATDEALEALVATPAKTNAAEAVAFTAPAEGAVVPVDPVPTFKWAIKGGDARLPPADLLRLPGHTETHEPGWIEGLIHAREAHAHGVPISGRAYFVTFSDAAGTPVLRVFTQKLEYTPAADALEKLAVAGAVKADVVNAIFEENRIVADGGPFTGTPRSFSVTR